MYKNILIYNSGGGLGDSIQLFPLILSLKNHFMQSNFHYLGAHENHFTAALRDYKISIKTLNLGIKFFGFRWWHFLKAKKELSHLEIKKFDLIIDLQSKLRNTIILRRLSHNDFYSSTYNFFFCSKKERYDYHDNITDMTLLNLEKFLKEKIKKVNFNLKNLDESFFNEAKRLLPKNKYIGFSLTQGNEYRKKSWPLEKFINLAKKVEKKNRIPVFFLEKSKKNLAERIKNEIPNALFPELKSNLSGPGLVTALSSNLESAVSIDNGVMHMISLTNIPMTVLFGPTNSKKFAPDQKNVKILDSNKMYGVKDINKITVDDVLETLNF